MATTVTAQLTQAGLDQVYAQGVLSAIRQVSVTDKLLYDVTVDPPFHTAGGERKNVIQQTVCGGAGDKSISENELTESQTKTINQQITWGISNASCNKPFDSSNVDMTIHLDTYINYLTSTLGEENYDFNNRVNVTFIDGITANIQTFQPSDYTYKTTRKENNINVAYKLTDTSVKNFTNSVTAMMSNDYGTKKLINNSRNKFPSNIMFGAMTNDDTNGKGNEWFLSMGPTNWGYCAGAKDSKNTVASKSNYYPLSTIDNMTSDEIVEKFSWVKPVALIGNANGSSGVYVFTDVTGEFSSGVDYHPTLAYQYVNIDGQSLLDGLITQLKTNITANYTEVTPGVYENQVDLQIDNTIINGVDYSDQVVGGNIRLKFSYDESAVVDSNYNNIWEINT